MATEEKIACRKLSLLDLAQELHYVSKACKVMGYSRQQFYEIRCALMCSSRLNPVRTATAIPIASS